MVKVRPERAFLRISSAELAGISILESGVEVGTVVSPITAVSGFLLSILKMRKAPSAIVVSPKMTARIVLILCFLAAGEVGEAEGVVGID